MSAYKSLTVTGLSAALVVLAAAGCETTADGETIAARLIVTDQSERPSSVPRLTLYETPAATACFPALDIDAGGVVETVEGVGGITRVVIGRGLGANVLPMLASEGRAATGFTAQVFDQEVRFEADDRNGASGFDGSARFTIYSDDRSGADVAPFPLRLQVFDRNGETLTIENVAVTRAADECP